MLNTHHPLSQSSRVSHWRSRPHFGQSGPPQSTSVSWLANTHNSVVVATINLVPQVKGSAFYLAIDDAIDARCWKADCGVARGGAIEAPAYGRAAVLVDLALFKVAQQRACAQVYHVLRADALQSSECYTRGHAIFEKPCTIHSQRPGFVEKGEPEPVFYAMLCLPDLS